MSGCNAELKETTETEETERPILHCCRWYGNKSELNYTITSGYPIYLDSPSEKSVSINKRAYTVEYPSEIASLSGYLDHAEIPAYIEVTTKVTKTSEEYYVGSGTIERGSYSVRINKGSRMVNEVISNDKTIKGGYSYVSSNTWSLSGDRYCSARFSNNTSQDIEGMWAEIEIDNSSFPTADSDSKIVMTHKEGKYGSVTFSIIANEYQ